MKTFHFIAIAAALALVTSCEMLTPQNSSKENESSGVIRLKFLQDNILALKGDSDFPDTNAFILKISSPSEVIYHGKYCDAPGNIPVENGTYEISALSYESAFPDFDCPQWGDRRQVQVSSGESKTVELVCRQCNCGIRLEFDKAFIEKYPDACLFIDSDEGNLAYPYSEQRYAYFQPGIVSLMMSDEEKADILMKRNLTAGEMLSLKVDVQSGNLETSCRIQIQLDTARTYTSGSFTLAPGFDVSYCMTIAQARSSAGASEVWVGGYIVGGDISSKSAKYTAPFTSSSNILLGPRSSADSRDDCLAIQLPSGTDARNTLNLVDHPELLGTYVCLKGNIVESYYSMPGMKETCDFRIGTMF